MARIIKQRTGPPYLLIIMTFLALVATAIAVKERAARDRLARETAEARKLTKALVSKDELRTGPVQHKIARFANPPHGEQAQTVFRQLDAEIEKLIRAITFRATSVEQALKAARRATAGPDGMPRRGLVSEIELLRDALARLVGPDGRERIGVIREMKDRVRTMVEQLAAKEAQLQVLIAKQQDRIAALQRIIHQRDKDIVDEHAKHVRLRTEAKARADRRAAVLFGQIESNEARIARQSNRLRDQDMVIHKLRRSVVLYKELAGTAQRERDKAVAIARKIVPDGEVMSDPDRSGYCHIDIGKVDNVKPGWLFAVYEAGEISGIAQRKGTLVVTTVLPNISECRVTSDVGGDEYTVSRGDVVANVAFDKRFTQTFVVAGLFDLYGTGRPSLAGTETVKKIIRSHGGKIADKVTVHVDYVVLGTEPPRPPESTDDDPPQVRRARREAGKASEKYKAIATQAVELHIPVMNTSRFVRDMGYVDEKRLVYSD